MGVGVGGVGPGGVEEGEEEDDDDEHLRHCTAATHIAAKASIL